MYYVQLEGGDVYYSISASDSPEAAILNPGDRISLTASEEMCIRDSLRA